MLFVNLGLYTSICGGRIQKDAVDPEKLQATLSDESLNDACDLKRAIETVQLLEAQLKDMNPNLDSIAEYEYFISWTSLLILFL